MKTLRTSSKRSLTNEDSGEGAFDSGKTAQGASSFSEQLESLGKACSDLTLTLKGVSKSLEMGSNSSRLARINRAPGINGGKSANGKLPPTEKHLKRLSPRGFSQLLDEITKQTGLQRDDPAHRQKPSDDAELNQDATIAAERDHRYQWLRAQDLGLGTGKRGQLYIECPFRDGHSMDSGRTETAYFPAGTGGYYQGHYKCMHASCANRSADDFDYALGYPGEDLSDVFEAHDDNGEILVDLHDPMSTARLVYEREFSQGVQPTLIRISGSWFKYTGTHYSELSEEDVRSAIWLCLEKALTYDKKGQKVPVRPSVTQIGAIIDTLKAVACRLESTEACWLDGRSRPPPERIVALRNGLFDLQTRKLLPHSSAFFCQNALPFDAPAKGEHAPRFMQFLEETWPNDKAAQQTLQEFVGYLLTPDTSQQKGLMIIGPRRSGKGVLGRLMRELLGRTNIAAPTMSNLAGNFGLQPLIGKLLAIIPDARFRHGQYSHHAVEKILMITGEDTATIDRKNREAWTGTLSTRIVVLSNEVPKLSDTSGAVASRFITLQMSRSFLGKEDPGLTDKLLTELPGIFAWALEGLERLNKRGYFLQPESGRELSDKLSELGNPIRSYVQEYCVLDPKASTTVEELFQAYREWCAENGHYPAAKNVFSQDIETAFPELRRHQPRVGEEGKQVRSFRGIGLQPNRNDGGDDGYI